VQPTHLVCSAHDQDGHQEHEARAQEVEHDGTQGVAPQEGHEEAETKEDHDLDVDPPGSGQQMQAGHGSLWSLHGACTRACAPPPFSTTQAHLHVPSLPPQLPPGPDPDIFQNQALPCTKHELDG